VLDPAIAERYRGMERADSLVLDPHKWLGVPVDAGCALFRRGDDVRDAFTLIPPYLRQDTGTDVGTFAEYGPEQTRPFRALKTWATIAALGRAGIAAQVSRANARARELASLWRANPSWSWPPSRRPPSSPSVLARRLPAGTPGGGQPGSAGGGSGTRPRLRHRHGLRRARDAACLHPPPGSRRRALRILVEEVVATARRCRPRVEMFLRH
jgi:glutamate/tyrosine decarboxylase-like PLP-dependent enzyme